MVEEVESNVAAFGASIARGDSQALEATVALYRGPFLDGYVETWVLLERQRREQAFLEDLETLAERALTAGDPATAERDLRRAIATDPLRESAYRSLMRALAAEGNHGAAFQLYRDLRLLLHREINAQPDPEIEALFHALQAEVTRRSDRRPPTAYQRLPANSQEPGQSPPGCGRRWWMGSRRPS